MEKKSTIRNILSVLLLVFLTPSCSSDLDFNQSEDLLLTPVIVANLTNFDVPAPDFVEGGVETTVAFEVENFDVFRDTFFRDNLQQADFLFVITNTIDRDYVIELILYDIFNNVVDSIVFNIPASAGTPQVITEKKTYQNASLDQLKRTDKMGFRITMLPGTPLTESSAGSLKLKSSATVYMEIE
ncbi:hypothetical protein [Flavobacterium algicola]|uniref:hypothetical protein n=1 Tax=Flavobacterium algicola TaxID=556529 RepID=UPI001EFE96E9|nr:hypothetical protein [Flavobacterium algicola]MCG9793288.1 hypothetical protein [Flavobacterium algicola]